MSFMITYLRILDTSLSIWLVSSATSKKKIKRFLKIRPTEKRHRTRQDLAAIEANIHHSLTYQKVYLLWDHRELQ